MRQFSACPQCSRIVMILNVGVVDMSYNVESVLLTIFINTILIFLAYKTYLSLSIMFTALSLKVKKDQCNILFSIWVVLVFIYMIAAFHRTGKLLYCHKYGSRFITDVINCDMMHVALWEPKVFLYLRADVMLALFTVFLLSLMIGFRIEFPKKPLLFIVMGLFACLLSLSRLYLPSSSVCCVNVLLAINVTIFLTLLSAYYFSNKYGDCMNTLLRNI
ncbi:MAG: hypothetical protein BWY28_02857 [bacterium ADurb.Bin236]|nr:MAG: hypothetical protein BWY28_02857 [bacterium ADurb.Bin236]